MAPENAVNTGELEFQTSEDPSISLKELTRQGPGISDEIDATFRGSESSESTEDEEQGNLESPILFDKEELGDGGDAGDADDADPLAGVVLGGWIKIGKLISHDNHSDVYSAVIDGPSLWVGGDIEVRVFSIYGIDKKLAQYRRRNMHRLGKRSIWTPIFNGKHIFIYRRDKKVNHMESLDPPPASGPDSVASPDMQCNTIAAPEQADFLTPTRRKAETARMKQQRRRAKQREARRSADGGSDALVNQDGAGNGSGVDNPRRNPTQEQRKVDALLALSRLQAFEESMLQQDVAGGDATLQSYTLPSCLKDDYFESILPANETKLSLLRESKMAEGNYLRSLQVSLPQLRDKMLQKYLSLCTKPMLQGKSTEEWEEKKTQALETYQALDGIGPFVEELLQRADEFCLKAAEHIGFLNGKRLAIEAVTEKLDKRAQKEKLRNLADILVPSTPAYVKVNAELESMALSSKNGGSRGREDQEPDTFAGLFELYAKLSEEYVKGISRGPARL